MKKIVAGILAHVDAGKTTLAEAMLYRTGKLRKIGRVDHGDTALDTHTLERERGITIFASQAVFSTDKIEVTLLDTPGHVDFSSETERTLSVLDYAILVISGLDGVQSHTLTLWKLLKLYNVPTFVFVTKMDFARKSREEIIENLNSELDGEFVDFGDEEAVSENMALCSESLMEKYLSGEKIDEKEIAEAIKLRKIFPCFFGSGLKLDGIDKFIKALEEYAIQPEYPEVFGAKVFKISHDSQGVRLTHIKVTGGSVKVREMIGDEKISCIRIYSGAKFTTADEVRSGEICALTGLDKTHNGQGLGFEDAGEKPTLEPVMNYRVVLPDGCDADTLLPKLRELEEEDPQLHVTWNSHLKEIHVGLMGEVQAEILKSIVAERFGVKIDIDSGRVMYKETIENTVEGVGHYDPLRHYAEVHLIMEPLPRGAGLIFKTDCSEDTLDRNWQRLILTHLCEKTHLGVLTGSPITDIEITLVSGKAHAKHTEGGDFRQATYRAVRQGLMEAGTIILEPEYDFTLEIPASMIGHAMTDLQSMYAVMEAPEQLGDRAIIRGHGPVATLRDYQLHVRAFTKGQGEFQVSFRGYMPCHNEEEVIQTHPYDPEADLRNPTSSVFCAHGSGFLVPWDQVKAYMHVSDATDTEQEQAEYTVHSRENFDYSIGLDEIDAILSGQTANQNAKKQIYKKKIVRHTETYTGKASKVIVTPKEKRLIVDGYNVIFAWESLSELAKTNLDAAKDKLISLLSNYQGITGVKTLLVFDGYKVKGNHGSTTVQEDIEIVHTKENQTADQFIEAYTHENEGQYQMTVATSDGLIQTITRGAGCQIISSRELYSAMEAAAKELREMYDIK